MGYGIFGLKRHVTNFFVGSYGSDFARGVYVFQLDEDNGEILKKKYYKSPAGPTFMTREDRWIYTCYKNNSGRASDGGIWQYAAMDIQFGLTARVDNDGKTYEHCCVSPENNCVYAVDYYNGEVASVPIKKLKVVTVAQTIKHEGHSIDEKRQNQPHPIYVCTSPDKKKVIVCDLGTDEVVYYNILEKGRLQRDEEHSFHVTPGHGPKKLLFTKNNKYAYLLNELSNTIEVYSHEDNNLTLIQTLDTFPKDGFNGTSFAGDMVMMESEEYLFASNRGHDSISVFKIDLETGLLTYIEFVDTDANPRVIQLFKDQWMVVAAQKGGTLESWQIKTNDRHGVLFETNYTYNVAEPVTIVLGNQNYLKVDDKKGK